MGDLSAFRWKAEKEVNNPTLSCPTTSVQHSTRQRVSDTPVTRERGRMVPVGVRGAEPG